MQPCRASVVTFTILAHLPPRLYWAEREASRGPAPFTDDALLVNGLSADASLPTSVQFGDDPLPKCRRLCRRERLMDLGVDLMRTAQKACFSSSHRLFNGRILIGNYSTL